MQQVGVLLEAPTPRPQASKAFLTIDLTSEVLNEALADPSIGVIVAYVIVKTLELSLFMLRND
jgi:hypothetical protein